jgi:hypothetical protein
VLVLTATPWALAEDELPPPAEVQPEIHQKLKLPKVKRVWISEEMKERLEKFNTVSTALLNVFQFVWYAKNFNVGKL